MATMILMDGLTTGNGPVQPTGPFAANTPATVGVLVRGLDGTNVQLYIGETDTEADMVPLREGLFEQEEGVLIRLPRNAYIQARLEATSSTAVDVLLFGD